MTARKRKRVREKAVMAGRLEEGRVQALKALALAQVRAFRLAEVRSVTGLNQEELAEKLGVSQSRESRIEHGELEHTELATLRAFVQALGRELEVTVKRGDERFVVG